MSYQIDDYTVYLKSNLIKVITIDQRTFELELDYNNFFVCNDNDELYLLLDSYLLNNNVEFILEKNKLIFNIKIDIGPLKRIVKIEIPEIINNSDDVATLMKKINILTNKVSILEKRLGYAVFFNDNYVQPINIKSKIMIIGDPNYMNKFSITAGKDDFGLDANILKMYNEHDLYLYTMLTSRYYLYNENPNLDNIKFMTELEILFIKTDYKIIDNINNIRYLEKLKVLHLGKTDIKNINFCKYLNNLEYLILEELNDLEDINILDNCNKLKILKIIKCPNIKNINKLCNPKLEIIKS